MKVAVGCDHGGRQLQGLIIEQLQALGHDVDNLGCDGAESVDYPDYARSVCAAVEEGRCDRGILICGTGIGMSMAANRFQGIRAALCHEPLTARLSREHNNANILCLGGRIIGPGMAAEIVYVWLSTDFAGGRHQRRIDMF